MLVLEIAVEELVVAVEEDEDIAEPVVLTVVLSRMRLRLWKWSRLLHFARRY